MDNQHIDGAVADDDREDEAFELDEANLGELADSENQNLEGEDLEALETRMGELTQPAFTTDSVRSYLQEIGKVKLLTLEDMNTGCTKSCEYDNKSQYQSDLKPHGLLYSIKINECKKDRKY